MDLGLLPPYRVRRSGRARQARLSYHPRTGLTVVLPQRYDLGRVPELVSRHLDWVRRTEARLGAGRLQDASVDGPFPVSLPFRAVAEEWAVRYEPGPGLPRARVVAERALVVSGPQGAFPPVADALGAWCSSRARELLEPAATTLAGELGERLERVTIRSQKSRWGSCSSRGTISLNRNLLFLPPHLARLVLLHEVCHLRELSHSPRFWALLCAYEPRARALSRELRLGWHWVPAWADPQGGLAPARPGT